MFHCNIKLLSTKLFFQLSTWAPILTSIDIIYKLNLALFVLLLYICIFLVLLFFDGNKENKTKQMY